MYRSWIPKPNKPGQMRAITQPNKTEIIVMDALSHLLNIIFEDLFLSQSHGFRKGRGPITFFIQIRSWNRVDKLMKSDIVKSFDNIDHGLCFSILQSHLGEENASFCDLISAFLKTQILDKKGNDYSNYMKGIPQGSSLSPVLMNIFMHQLDMNLHYFMQTEESLGYARYADDMIFAINNELDSEGVYLKFRNYFQKALNDLKLSETSIELVRSQPRKTRVWGLVVSISSKGILEIRAPLNDGRRN